MKVSIVCVVGNHEGPEMDSSDFQGKRVKLPHGWRQVRVRLINNQWVYDPSSPLDICVCPNHIVKGEPAIN